MTCVTYDIQPSETLSGTPNVLEYCNNPGKRNPIDKALKSNLDTSPKSEPALEYISGLRQVWRHITAQLVLTQEEIPEEGG